MKKLSEINALESGRKIISNWERSKLQKQQREQEKVEGYQQLVELCVLGEYEIAQNLATRHLEWGYQIANGQVVEQV